MTSSTSVRTTYDEVSFLLIYGCLPTSCPTPVPKQVPWDLVPAAAEEDPDGQTLLFHYPSVMAKDAAYLRPVVKIEMGARSDTEPFGSPSIQSYLAETFPEALASNPFPVRCLLPERTFWEMWVMGSPVGKGGGG